MVYVKAQGCESKSETREKCAQMWLNARGVIDPIKY